MLPKREDSYERFRRLMPRSQDLSLIILKGHLLIEEQLQHFLDDLARKPELLRDARLTFFQRWRLVQAIASVPRDHLVRFVESVSKLRNQLAHEAEVRELENRVDDLLRMFYEDEFIAPRSKTERARELKNAFAFTVSMVSGYCSGFLIGLGDPWKRKVGTN